MYEKINLVEQSEMAKYIGTEFRQKSFWTFPGYYGKNSLFSPN